jgi:hypothetical protein
MQKQNFENKLMRVITTIFLLLFCLFMFFKFLLD